MTFYIILLIILLIAFSLLFAYFIAGRVQYQPNQIRELYRALSVKEKLIFHEKDSFYLIKELETTPFEKTEDESENEIENIAFGSDKTSTFYFFDRSLNTGNFENRNMFTLCLAFLNRDLKIRAFLGKKELCSTDSLSLIENTKMKKIDLNVEPRFKNSFCAYSDNEDLLSKVLTEDLIEFFLNKINYFINPNKLSKVGEVTVYLWRNKVIVAYKHGSSDSAFTTLRDLDNFYKFSIILKDCLSKP